MVKLEPALLTVTWLSSTAVRLKLEEVVDGELRAVTSAIAISVGPTHPAADRRALSLFHHHPHHHHLPHHPHHPHHHQPPQIRTNDDVVDIDRYTVSSVVRGKGVGARMMAYMTAWCWTIYPHVQVFRVRAPQSRGFYHSLGFTSNGQDLVLKVGHRFNR